MKSNSTLSTQFLRYGVIGLISNLFLYLSYLLITYLGMGHKLAMTLLYVTGVTMTFIFNKKWTFDHYGHISKTFMSYLLVYVFGYILNLSGLYFFVDKLGYPHEWVQGILVFFIALLLFLLQKTIVFKKYATDV